MLKSTVPWPLSSSSWVAARVAAGATAAREGARRSAPSQPPSRVPVRKKKIISVKNCFVIRCRRRIIASDTNYISKAAATQMSQALSIAKFTIGLRARQLVISLNAFEFHESMKLSPEANLRYSAGVFSNILKTTVFPFRTSIVAVFFIYRSSF